MKEKISKEMQDLIEAINKWFDKHQGNVSFIGSFVAFNKNDDVIDDRIFSYGNQDTLKEQIYALAECVTTSKKEFVNI